MSEILSAIRVSAKVTPARYAIIFLHGLGDSGEGWSWLPKVISDSKMISESDKINYVFPSAKSMPITANFGHSMPGWFDLYDFGNPNGRQDVDGILKTCNVLKELIQEQEHKYNIPKERIVIGGFSQGAAISLVALTMLDYKIGGVVALSGFCPIRDKIKESFSDVDVNKNTPIFQGHGSADPVIPFEYGKLTNEFYKGIGFNNSIFNTYANAGHTVTEQELVDVMKFLNLILQ